METINKEERQVTTETELVYQTQPNLIDHLRKLIVSIP